MSIELGTGSTAVRIGTVCLCQNLAAARSCLMARPHRARFLVYLANDCWPGQSLSAPVRAFPGPVLCPRDAQFLIFGPGRFGPGPMHTPTYDSFYELDDTVVDVSWDFEPCWTNSLHLVSYSFMCVTFHVASLEPTYLLVQNHISMCIVNDMIEGLFLWIF